MILDSSSVAGSASLVVFVRLRLGIEGLLSSSTAALPCVI